MQIFIFHRVLYLCIFLAPLNIRRDMTHNLVAILLQQRRKNENAKHNVFYFWTLIMILHLWLHTRKLAQYLFRCQLFLFRICAIAPPHILSSLVCPDWVHS